MKQKHTTQNNLLVEQGRKAETQNTLLIFKGIAVTRHLWMRSFSSIKILDG